MAFKVSDGRKKRKHMISRYVAQDPTVGVLLAAADFEWTCRRSILAMGFAPTKEIKSELFEHREYGLQLKKGWEQQVRQKGKGIEKFEDIFDKWARQSQSRYVLWADVEYAMSWRNKLIHGIEGGIGDANGAQCVNILECANDILEAYLQFHKLSAFQMIRRVKGDWSVSAKAAYEKRQKEAKDNARKGKDVGSRRAKSKDEVIIDGVRMLKAKLKEQFGVSASKCANVVKEMKVCFGMV